ncbi:hypothetical protein Trydic_g6876 [Trypoxylus dichotomus]
MDLEQLESVFSLLNKGEDYLSYFEQPAEYTQKQEPGIEDTVSQETIICQKVNEEEARKSTMETSRRSQQVPRRKILE